MDGQTLLKAAEIIVKAETQIDALIESLDRNLRDELEKQYGGVDISEKYDDWIWFRNYALTKKGRRKASQHIAIQVVLYDDEEVDIDGWEPSLYVMYGNGPEPFNIKDEWGFALSEPLNAFLPIKHGDRLLQWKAPEDDDAGWGFVLPLVKLNSEKVLIEQIIAPVKKLLGDINHTDAFHDSVALQFTVGNDGIKILGSVNKVRSCCM